MAQETALHTWDAARCLGATMVLDDALAVDGIEEIRTMFLPRQLRLGWLTPGPEVVELRAGTTYSTVLATDPQRAGDSPQARVHGPPEAVLLMLWKRIPVTDPRLVVTGDLAALDCFIAAPLTP